jgi:hypothetical protein
MLMETTLRRGRDQCKLSRNRPDSEIERSEHASAFETAAGKSRCESMRLVLERNTCGENIAGEKN